MVWWQDGITWLLLSPDQSLAFLLADNGFDVWLANTRGTKYSRGHASLSPNDPVIFLSTLRFNSPIVPKVSADRK
jgi:hypothetical protein